MYVLKRQVLGVAAAAVGHGRVFLRQLAFISAAMLVGCGGSGSSSGGIGGFVPPATGPGPALEIASLSTGASTASGGDVLMEVRVPDGVDVAEVEVKLNQQDVTQAFKQNQDNGHFLGLVKGLGIGRNLVSAGAKGDRGSVVGRAELVVENHPITGPVFSGPQQTPFLCETAAFGLGAPQDANCSANTKVEYVYFSTGSAFKAYDPADSRPADMARTTTSEGTTVDYIVRLETGTINRAVYQIAMLHTPGTPLPSPWKRTASWNQRLAYTFGGGCSAGYHQGRTTGGVLDLLGAGTGSVYLARGYAVASSSLNVWGNNCNDLVTAETAMMVKEYFIERFGVPHWTVGFGGSGGSMQQHLIAQNYPGILDGIFPFSSFPDIFTMIPPVVDCSLLQRAFDTSAQAWTYEQKTAVAGYAGWNSCVQGTGALTDLGPGTLSWINVRFSPGWIVPGAAGGGCDAAIPASQIYDPATNSKGIRCTVQDNMANGLGLDPVTGFARRAYDNVGIQYGLKAFNKGQISTSQFIDLNARIGGYDADGGIVASRSAADAETLRIAYSLGRVNTGGGGLSSVPIIDARRYQDGTPDIHDRIRSLSTRERLIAANGNADNHVILTTATTATLANSPFQTLVWEGALKLEQWLDAIAADRSPHRLQEKVVRNRPNDLLDACYDASGQKIEEQASAIGTGKCNQLYPPHGDPRLVAGAPLANDILKCQLKPVSAVDYAQPLQSDELARLREIFPGGVCDYSLPGVAQQKTVQTWLAYPQPGTAVRLESATAVRLQ